MNVIVINWQKGADVIDYLHAENNAKTTGLKVGEFIINSGIDPMSIHCIGHSLGGHVGQIYLF